MRQLLPFLIKGAVSAGLVVLLARNFDIEQVGAAILRVDLWVVSAAFLALFAQTFVIAARWRRVIFAIGGEIGYRPAVEAVMVSLFFNQGLPSSLGGDAVRIWRLHGSGAPLRVAFRSVVIDRIVALVALAIVVALGLPALAARVGIEPIWFLAAGLSAVGIAATALLAIAGPRLPTLGSQRLAAIVADLSMELRVVLGQPAQMLRVVGATWVSHSLALLAVVLIARNLGLVFDIVDAFALVPPVLFVSVLPISLAGWGVREGAMVLYFSAAGFEGPESMVISVLIGLLMLASGLLGGVVWFFDDSLRSEIRHQQDEHQQDEHRQDDPRQPEPKEQGAAS